MATVKHDVNPTSCYQLFKSKACKYLTSQEQKKHLKKKHLNRFVEYQHTMKTNQNAKTKCKTLPILQGSKGSYPAVVYFPKFFQFFFFRF